VGFKQLDAISLVWALLALFLLQRLKLQIIPMILLGIGFGLISSLLGR